MERSSIGTSRSSNADHWDSLDLPGSTRSNQATDLGESDPEKSATHQTEQSQKIPVQARETTSVHGHGLRRDVGARRKSNKLNDEQKKEAERQKWFHKEGGDSEK